MINKYNIQQKLEIWQIQNQKRRQIYILSNSQVLSYLIIYQNLNNIMNILQEKNCLIQPFLQIFCNWRIKNQILMVQLFVSSIVSIFIALSYYYSFYIVRQIFITNHENILLKKYLIRSTNNNLLHYKQMTKISLIQTDILLYQSLNFYEFAFRDNLYINYNPLQCLQKPPNDTIIMQSTFCYGIFGNKEHIGMNEKLNNLSKVLTLFIPLLQTDNIYYGSSSKEQYFSYWPGSYFNDSFIPHKRIWYIIAQNPIDNHLIQYTPPYLSVMGRIYVSKMVKLRNDGVVSINTKLPNYQLSMNSDSETPQILDQNGLLYYTQEYENLYQNILYFNQSNKTGFTQEDLNQILNLRNNKKFNNSCDIILENSICRKNIYGQEYNFFLQDIEYPNLTILVKIESYKFKTILNDLFRQFDQFRDEVLQNLYILIASIISLCLLFFIGSTYYLQKPLDRLLDFSVKIMVNQKFQSFNLEKASILLQSQSQSHTITKLQQAFINLISLQKLKYHSNNEKIQIEKIQYPKKTLRIRVSKLCQKTMINYKLYQKGYLDQINKILRRMLK
ncbi:hypothetical protein pb186bvf_014867 [Paramecium bursaria]